jgi:hypothetical protein
MTISEEQKDRLRGIFAEAFGVGYGEEHYLELFEFMVSSGLGGLVSGTDSSSGYLSEKIVEGQGVDIEVVEEGGVEKLKVTLNLDEIDGGTF